jgi:trans-2,3-dihydro-3-hydroxyanthranilate isomerase
LRSYRYLVVDVFTEVSFAGNMLGVFPDATGLTDGDMQAIARELNLSETSFVFPPRDASALARLRLFTPEIEVPFAGHPTIGTAFALAHLGRVPSGVETFVLDEVVGPVSLRLERRADPFVAWLRTPPIATLATLDRDACAAALGLEANDLLDEHPAQILSAGNPFLYLAARDAETVDRAILDARALVRLAPPSQAIGVFLFAPTPNNVFYSRMLAPLSGVPEDPATGSATGPLGAYLVERGLLARRDGERFTNEQGVRMKRRSLVHGIVRVASNGALAVDVGGSAVLTAEGTMFLPVTTLA